jgi:quinol monooxygenase YgiN
MAGGYALTVRFTTRDADAAQQFDALVARTLEGIRREAGTIAYVIHVPTDDPNARVFYELYADHAAFLAHEEQPHTRHFLEERDRYLTDTEVTFMNQQGGKIPGMEGP